MGHRLGQLTAALAFVMMLGRLGRILETGAEFAQWQVILVAAALIGSIAWWLLDQTTPRLWPKLAVFAVVGLLLALRISVPETLTAGLIPTLGTPAALLEEMSQAFRLIRSGVPPVVPHPGLIAILSVVMWAMGALFAWGNTTGPVTAMFLPPTIMYLQFAVFDRSNAGLGWLLPSTLVIGLGLLTMAFGRRDLSGRARDPDGRPVQRKTVGLAAITAAVVGIGSLALADAASLSISEYGMAPWRGGSGVGEGPGGGGIGFDGLVDLRQRVLNLSETPVFEATFEPGAPPGDQVYWRMETLDEFTGAEWRRSDASLRRFEPGLPFALETNIYRGTTHEFSQVVRIRALRSDIAPVAGVPVAVEELDSAQVSSARFPTEFNSLGDAALAVNGGLDRNDTYQVRTVAADRTADVGAMATTDSGSLSPIFAGAVAAGEAALEPATDLPQPLALPDQERYLELPADTPPSLAGVAARETRGATTDFERAWMLQAWFRDSGDFTYTTDVDTGHSALRLDDWLSDPDSPNHRQGYCEQFAAAMGVLLRAADIPSRVVWGFTPGVVEDQENGTEKVIVRETNAHAWVEAWIEPFGWVQFDPTPRGEFQPPSLTAAFDPAEYVPERDFGPIVPPDVSDFGEDLDFVDPGAQGDDARSVRWWLIGLVAAIPILLFVPGLKRLRRRRRLARLRDGDITAAWDEVVDRLTDLGIPPEPSATPLEAARATDRALVSLATRYSAALYGGRSDQGEESDLMDVEWWIDRNFDTATRARASFSPKSLLKREE